MLRPYMADSLHVIPCERNASTLRDSSRRAIGVRHATLPPPPPPFPRAGGWGGGPPPGPRPPPFVPRSPAARRYAPVSVHRGGETAGQVCFAPTCLIRSTRSLVKGTLL